MIFRHITINNIIRSLQARSIKIYFLQKIKQARSRIASLQGSITVEASLAIPIFLCMMVALLSLGQFVLIESQVQHALSQTARDMARQEAAVAAGGRLLESGGLELGDKVPSALVGAVEIADANVLFRRVYQASAVSGDCLVGGANGIVVTSSKKQAESITVRATYSLKVPFLSIFHKYYIRNPSVTQRIFSGYLPHGGDGDEGKDGDVVYVTTHGKVYHTSVECSYVTKKISDIDEIRVIEEKRKPCSVCIKAGDHPSSLYVTSGGERYHSSLTCSEINHSYRAVNVNEIGDMHMCSKCAKNHG